MKTDHEAEVAHDETVRRVDIEDVVATERVVIDDASRVIRREAPRLRAISLASAVDSDVVEVHLRHRRW